MLECEQILSTGNLVLDRDSAIYKSIRNGEWTLDRIRQWFEVKERNMETLYHSNKTLPKNPDEKAIQRLLMECMEMHYGSLSDAVITEDAAGRILLDLKEIVKRYDT